MPDDLRRLYLKQQAELGGSEVVLPRGPGHREVAAPAQAPGEGAAAERPSPVKPAEPGPAGKGARHWSVDAPPIPGAGLTVETGASLLDEGRARLATMEEVAEGVAACTRCGLAATRTRTVPGEGAPDARLMLVGEGPGANEDATGRPFVGAAGRLLDKILEAIETPRETVFIANIVKCRPPQNRKPLPDEAAACLPFLWRQVALVRPKVLVALGGTAAEGLLGVRKSLGELRGKVHRLDGIPLVVTYHPAALLRNPNWKKPTWDDIRIARQLLDR